MSLNRLTVQRLVKKRLAMQEAEAMQKGCVLPSYYEIHSGIIDYRSGKWIQHDIVDIVQTKTSALEELRWRRAHPINANQNAAYIVRRYRHGNKDKITENNRKAVESIFKGT